MVVGLLEDLVRADAGRFDGEVAVVVQRRGVDVDAANFAAAGPRRVHVLNALGDELGVVVRVLAEDEDQPLVPFFLQGENLLAKFVFVERAADRLAVRAAKRAVRAVVHALVADVQRGEQHDPVAVHVAFQLPGGVENRFDQLGLGCRQQYGRLFYCQWLLRQTLSNDVADLARLRAALQQGMEMGLIDEIMAAAAEFVRIKSNRHDASLNPCLLYHRPMAGTP